MAAGDHWPMVPVSPHIRCGHCPLEVTRAVVVNNLGGPGPALCSDPKPKFPSQFEAEGFYGNVIYIKSVYEVYLRNMQQHLFTFYGYMYNSREKRPT